MLQGKPYNHSADCFSFGIILGEIAARISANPDLFPRTNSFGVDYDKLKELCHPGIYATLHQAAGDGCRQHVSTNKPLQFSMKHHFLLLTYPTSVALNGRHAYSILVHVIQPCNQVRSLPLASRLSPDIPDDYFTLLVNLTSMVPDKRPTFPETVRILENLLHAKGTRYNFDVTKRMRTMSMGTKQVLIAIWSLVLVSRISFPALPTHRHPPLVCTREHIRAHTPSTYAHTQHTPRTRTLTHGPTNLRNPHSTHPPAC